MSLDVTVFAYTEAMTNVSLQEAQERLPELVERAEAGEVVIIASEGREVALVNSTFLASYDGGRTPKIQRFSDGGKPIFGAAAGTFVIPDDFDEPLEDFREYVE
jgi:prevent-host-death family protein